MLVSIHWLDEFVQSVTLAFIVLSGFITCTPPLAAVYHPLNTCPAFVAVGIALAVEFDWPEYVAAFSYDTYTGDVPDIVPSLLATLNATLALYNAIVLYVVADTVSVVFVPSLA